MGADAGISTEVAIGSTDDKPSISLREIAIHLIAGSVPFAKLKLCNIIALHGLAQRFVKAAAGNDGGFVFLLFAKANHAAE